MYGNLCSSFDDTFYLSGKRYGVIDVAACLSMSVGLILFTLADSKVQPEFNHTGQHSKLDICILKNIVLSVLH